MNLMKQLNRVIAMGIQDFDLSPLDVRLTQEEIDMQLHIPRAEAEAAPEPRRQTLVEVGS